MIKKDLNTIN